MLPGAPEPAIRNKRRRWISGRGKTGKHDLLQVSGRAGEHVQQETFINLEPLIGSLEGAFSICLRRRRARVTLRRLEQHGMSSIFPLCNLLDQGHSHTLLLALLSWLSPAAPGEDEFLSLLSSQCCWLLLTPVSAIKVPRKTLKRTQIAN